MDLDQRENSKLEAAAITYIQTCLAGKAFRLSQKWDMLYQREKLSLNEPVYGNNTEENVNFIADTCDSLDTLIADKLLVEQALENLSVRETEVIYGLFWTDKQVNQLGRELQVSRKTVSQTKKHALGKLQRFVDKPGE